MVQPHTFSGAFVLMTAGLQTLTGTDPAGGLSASAVVTVQDGGPAPHSGGSPGHDQDGRLFLDPLAQVALELVRPLRRPSTHASTSLHDVLRSSGNYP